MCEAPRDPCRVPGCANDAEKEIVLCRPGRETEFLLCGEHLERVDQFDHLVDADHSDVYSVVYSVYDPNPACPHCEAELSSVVVDGDLFGYICRDCRIQWLGVTDLEVRRVHPTTDAEPGGVAYVE